MGTKKRARVAEPRAVPWAEPAPRAKLFWNGRSQAVRLPKEFRFDGTEVAIHREGDRVILEPVSMSRRTPGGWERGVWVARDFDAPLPPDVLRGFEGGDS
jgi:antitoxin VapB